MYIKTHFCVSSLSQHQLCALGHLELPSKLVLPCCIIWTYFWFDILKWWYFEFDVFTACTFNDYSPKIAPTLSLKAPKIRDCFGLSLCGELFCSYHRVTSKIAPYHQIMRGSFGFHKTWRGASWKGKGTVFWMGSCWRSKRYIKKLTSNKVYFNGQKYGL